MQERRTTIRFLNQCRAKYCPSDDLIPRDGRVANLSEHGVGLLVREPHQAGEQVTVSFFLPTDDEPLTATGVVRWAGERSRMGSWYPVGVEWMPNEDSIRSRVHEFLYQQNRPSRPTRVPAATRAKHAPASSARRFVWLAVCTLLVGTMSLALVWVKLLQEDRAQLAGVIVQRDEFIQQLEQRDRQVQQELATTKSHLSTAIAEAVRLNTQARRLTGEVQNLTNDVERYQASYARSQEEREQLIKRVMDLEQERTDMAKKLTSLYELRVAIHDAIESRKALLADQQRATAIARREALHAAEQQRLANGNRGYVIRDGKPTTSNRTVWIRILEPSDVIPSSGSPQASTEPATSTAGEERSENPQAPPPHEPADQRPSEDLGAGPAQ